MDSNLVTHGIQTMKSISLEKDKKNDIFSRYIASLDYYYVIHTHTYTFLSLSMSLSSPEHIYIVCRYSIEIDNLYNDTDDISEALTESRKAYLGALHISHFRPYTIQPFTLYLYLTPLLSSYVSHFFFICLKTILLYILLIHLYHGIPTNQKISMYCNLIKFAI